jgi:hypothetical protein
MARSIDPTSPRQMMNTYARSRVSINGETFNKAEKGRYNIMSGMKTLTDKNLTSYGTDIGESNLTAEAQKLLATLSVTIDSSKGKHYSFLSDQSDREVLNNPNIEGTDFEQMKNTTTKATDKFPNTDDDSFYTLGEDRRQFRTARTAVINERSKPSAAVQQVAADISIVNMNPGYNTKLLQFK